MKYIILIILCLLTIPESVFAQNEQDNIAVIVHESVITGNITTESLRDIYVLSIHNWEDDTRIRIIDYKGNNYIRVQFYNHLGLTTNGVKKIWLKAQFTGRTIPPKVVNSVSDMIIAVLDNPGAIGYVPSSRVPAEAIVLFEFKNAD